MTLNATKRYVVSFPTSVSAATMLSASSVVEKDRIVLSNFL
jgi:hypothetical protein